MSGLRILIVDDDALSGEMTAAVLESAGHDTVLAENGVDAIRILAQTRDIGLVVSDMNMPLVSGIDLFRELRAQAVRIPFILLTGDDPAPLLAEEPELDGCLIKDASIETALPDTVAAVLGRRTGMAR